MTKQQPFNLDREGILLWTRNKDSHLSGFAGISKSGTCRQNRSCFENETLKVV